MDYVFAVVTALFTFVSPCVLPLLPVYASYFASGEANRWKTLLNALAFCVGISIFFIAIFTSAALAGYAFSNFVMTNKPVINIICGILLVVFGLKIMGILRIPFLDKSISMKTTVEKVEPINAFILGVVFSFSMGMCAIGFASFNLISAITSASVFKGIMIGLLFTLTLDLLFVICAMFIDQLKGMFTFIRKHYRTINIISGCLLIVLGILLATQLMDRIQVFFTSLTI